MNSLTHHAPHHDLELFLYILIYICTKYHGPHGQTKKVSLEEMAPFLKEWFFSYNVQMVGQMKYGMLTLDDKTFHELYTIHFTPYFENLRDCVNSLRKIIAKKNCEGATHMDLIRLFRDTAETLPDIEPDDVKLSGPVFKRHNLDEKDLASADADNIPDELKPEYLQFPTTIGED